MWRQRVSSLSLSESSFTICTTPYNLKYNMLSASLHKTFPGLCFFLSLFVCCHYLFVLFICFFNVMYYHENGCKNY